MILDNTSLAQMTIAALCTSHAWLSADHHHFHNVYDWPTITTQQGEAWDSLSDQLMQAKQTEDRMNEAASELMGQRQEGL
jgi:hypothetical protein